MIRQILHRPRCMEGLWRGFAGQAILPDRPARRLKALGRISPSALVQLCSLRQDWERGEAAGALRQLEGGK